MYSTNLEKHVEHLRLVFDVLRREVLYLKRSKYVFGAGQIEYLGHIITREGVATDLKKIEAIVQWRAPRALKQLRGFLGLTGYYRRFIRNYSVIA